MTVSIPTTPIESSRIADVDFDRVGFGDVFSDHMFQVDFRDGAWRDPCIVPYGPFPIEPGALCLHYGQTVFEGLKAFHGADGVARIFRPDRNLARLKESCRRLCIPPIDDELYYGAIDALVRIDREWIPKTRGKALYIRPLLIGTEPNLMIKPSDTYRFFIMTAPVREYFDGSGATISLKAERRYTRAAPGGTGAAKTGGNYAGSLLPGVESTDQGHDQVLWLDGIGHEYVEEVGQMNIFFEIDGSVVTPALRGTILPGVTRECVIRLLEDRGRKCEERRVRIDEIVEAAYGGMLGEVFGAGTAAVIAPVGRIDVDGQKIEVNGARRGPLAASLYDEILDIQCGGVEDRFGWNRLAPL